MHLKRHISLATETCITLILAPEFIPINQRQRKTGETNVYVINQGEIFLVQ